MEEEKRKELLKEFDRFSGGRSLSAIYESKTLNGREKHVLLYFGHTANFKKNGYVNFKAHRLNTIAEKIGVSRDTVRRALETLEAKGFVKIVQRNAQSGVQISNEYAMTHKVFDEYEESWLARRLEGLDEDDTASDDVGLQNARVGLQNARVVGLQNARVGSQNAIPSIDPSNSLPSSLSSPSMILIKDSEKKPVDKKKPRRRGKGEFTNEVLLGAMAGLYNPYAKLLYFKPCIALMIEIGTRAQIMKTIERQREKQIASNQGMWAWDSKDTLRWKFWMQETVEAARASFDKEEPMPSMHH